MLDVIWIWVHIEAFAVDPVPAAKIEPLSGKLSLLISSSAPQEFIWKFPGLFSYICKDLDPPSEKRRPAYPDEDAGVFRTQPMSSEGMSLV